jgi:hypothetical protein
MSAWDERFKNHPIHQKLADARTAVRKLKVPRKAVEATEARQRLARVLDHVAGVLGEADRELTPVGVLDEIHQQIAPLLTQVEYAENEEDTTYLESANQHADAMLGAAARAPRPVGSNDIARLQESATTFRQSAGQLTRHVREDADRLAGDIDTVRSEVAAARTEIDAQKGRVDQVISEHQEQFTTEQTDREERFRTTRGELENNAQGTLDNLRDMEEKAKRHLDVIGVVGMSGGYQEVADKEEKAANIWRLVAVGAAALAIAMNLALIVAIAAGWLEEDFEWDRQVPRVLLTLSLLALASYAGVESSRHRNRQGANREIEKELASLEPYLALFTDDEKKDLKKKKFDLFFKGHRGRSGTELPGSETE